VITRIIIIIIIIIIIQVVSRWNERVIACELDKRIEINKKKRKMARWQVYVGLQVTCRLLLDHTTSQQVSTELHKALVTIRVGNTYTAYRVTVTCKYFGTEYCYRVLL